MCDCVASVVLAASWLSTKYDILSSCGSSYAAIAPSITSSFNLRPGASYYMPTRSLISRARAELTSANVWCLSAPVRLLRDAVPPPLYAAECPARHVNHLRACSPSLPKDCAIQSTAQRFWSKVAAQPD